MAEDHAVVRQGLVELLNMVEGLEVGAEANDGWDAVARIRDTNLDVVLIDLHLPELSAAQVIQRTRDGAPQIAFIVLSTYDHDEDIHRVLNAGAQACLLADVVTEELVATIRVAYERHQQALSVTM